MTTLTIDTRKRLKHSLIHPIKKATILLGPITTIAPELSLLRLEKLRTRILDATPLTSLYNQYTTPLPDTGGSGTLYLLRQ